MLCNCKYCEAARYERRKAQMLKDHRLFSNNKSTTTHWYPSNNRAPIPIYALDVDHLAAIVDQYESEVLKFFRELTGYPHPESFKTSFITQGFLEKHVPAWKAIKQRQTNIQKNLPNIYRKLFLEKKYNEKKTDKTTHGGAMPSGKTEKINFDIETVFQNPFKPMGPSYIPSFKQTSFAQYWDGPKLTPEKKAQLHLQIVKAKVAANDAYANLQIWIDKNL